MMKYVFVILSVLIILTFGYTVFENALNLPSFDDYDATLAFIRNFFFEEQTPETKLKILFSFHNEHCVMISRVSAAVYYSIFKQIDFTPLVIYQNIFLLGFFGVILALMKQQGLFSYPALLLVTIFLFSLSFWQVSFYYWAGIQHYPVFFFSFLSMFLLNKTERARSWTFVFAVLCVCLSVFSFGNGLLALFAGAFLLVVNRKYKALMVWSIVSLGLLSMVFLSRVHSPSSSAEAFNFDWMARLFFTFLGSFLFINPSEPVIYYGNIIVCMIAGAAIFGFWIWLFFRGYAFRKPLLYVLLSLPILTGVIIAVSRFSTKAAGGIAPRYMFFTATIPVLVLLILVDLKIVNKRSLHYLSALGLLIWGTSFYNNRIALKRSNDEVVSDIKAWQKNPKLPLINNGNFQDYSDKLSWAVEQKLIVIPAE